MPNPNQGQNVTVRYVIYNLGSKRPISQGTCQRKDIKLVRESLPKGQNGQRLKILKSNDYIDLEPYDLILDPNRPADTGINAHRAGFAAASGKTVDDAITNVDDLDTE